MKTENVTSRKIIQIVESQEFKCALTGREMTPENASLDHIIPLSRGGKHDLGNVWVIDNQVNRAKGDMTSEEFIAMCREVVEYSGDRNS